MCNVMSPVPLYHCNNKGNANATAIFFFYCFRESAWGRYAHANSARTEEATQALPFTVTSCTKGRPQDVLQTHTFSWQWPQGPLQASPLFRPDQVCSVQFKASMTVPAQRRLVDLAKTTIRELFRTAMESVAVQQRFSNCSARTPVVSGIQQGVLLITFSNGN
ncbi:unnamed protein product [Ixodes pacificus]